MGYTIRRTVYRLDFSGTEYEGLEVRMSATTLGSMFEVGALLTTLDLANPSAEDLKAALFQYEELADHLVSWNAQEENGTPLPATLDGLKRMDMPMVVAIAQAWQRAMSEVAPPLPQRSSSSRPPDLSMIPMETLAG